MNNKTVLVSLTQQELRQIIKEEICTALQEHTPSANTPQCMTIDKVSELLGLSIPTVYGLVQNRKIPYSKFGKRLIFEHAEIKKWLQKHRRATTDEIQQQAQDYVNNQKINN